MHVHGDVASKADAGQFGLSNIPAEREKRIVRKIHHRAVEIDDEKRDRRWFLSVRRSAVHEQRCQQAAGHNRSDTYHRAAYCTCSICGQRPTGHQWRARRILAAHIFEG
jgi:hypothetical protein